MKNLKTKFMGIEINSPIVVGASNMVANLDNLKKAEENGAGAIVYKSLFEEQIQLERFQLEEELNEFNDIYAEMLTIHPSFNYAGPEEHLESLRKAKESLSIPLIASVNAVNSTTWIEYATLIDQTGVDGIELNLYQNLTNLSKEASEIEAEQFEIVNEIRKNVSIPVSVKLSSDYTNTLNFIKKLDEVGVNTFVLFNSFFQPDVDIVEEKHIKKFNFSRVGDYKKSLRYAGLLYGNINAEICSSHGVLSGSDAIKLILSGASSVQVVSTLYKNGFSQLSKMKKELEDWMDEKNYNSIADFQGKLSKKGLNNDPFVYKRAQYVDLLINSEKIFGQS